MIKYWKQKGEVLGVIYISPDEYNEELKRFEAFMEEADKFMSINRVILKDDSVDEMVKQGQILHGRMQIFKEALVANSAVEPKYLELINAINAKTVELQNYWKGFGVKSI